MEARSAEERRRWRRRRGGVYGGSFSFRVICGSLAVRIDAASRPITIHRTTITPLGYILTRATVSYALFPSLKTLGRGAEGGGEEGLADGRAPLTLSSARLIYRYLIINRRDFGQVPLEWEGKKGKNRPRSRPTLVSEISRSGEERTRRRRFWHGV